MNHIFPSMDDKKAVGGIIWGRRSREIGGGVGYMTWRGKGWISEVRLWGLERTALVQGFGEQRELRGACMTMPRPSLHQRVWTRQDGVFDNL